jgi:hypothetical protein
VVKDYAREIIVGLIVAVVGGLILAWLLGDGRFARDGTSAQSEDRPAVSPTATARGASQTAASTPTTRPTPRGITNPTNPVAAGTTVLAGDYALTATGQVKVYDYALAKKYISVGDLVLQNSSDTDRVFRFQRSSFTLRDDLGNTYTPADLARNDGDSSYYYDVVQINVPAQKSVVLQSHDGAWIEKRYPSFIGPIPLQAKKLYLMIDGFGPFPYLEIEIDL